MPRFAISRRARVLGIVTALSLIVAPEAARAADGDAREFFKGKTFRFITMGGAGGGFDAYMRIMMPHLQERLGVTIVPVNEPGAGGLVAMNRLIKEPADGLTMLLIFGSSLINGQIYGTNQGRYRVAELTWLARVTADPKVVLFGPKTPYKTFADALKSKGRIIWGGSGKTDGNSDYAAILSSTLGLPAKIIAGYRGSRKMLAAVERGELDAQILTDVSGARAAKRSEIRAVMTLDRKRSTRFPEVPTVFEVANPSPEQAWWLDWRAGVTSLGRLLVTKGGVPADRVALLRTTIKEIMAEPAYLDAMKKRRLSVNYGSGEQVEALVKKTVGGIDDKRMAELREAVLNKFYSR